MLYIIEYYYSHKQSLFILNALPYRYNYTTSSVKQLEAICKVRKWTVAVSV